MYKYIRRGVNGKGIVEGGSTLTVVKEDVKTKFSRKVVAIFPTYVERCTVEQHILSFSTFVNQLDRASLELKINVRLYLCLQYEHKNLKCAEDRVKDIVRSVSISVNSIGFRTILMDVKSKVYSINKCIEDSKNLVPDGVFWIDDDVGFNENCFTEIFKEFYRTEDKDIALGARKIPAPKKFRAARILHKIKLTIKTADRQYPHGCCILVGYEVIKSGIPLKFCDDGYVMFKLLDSKSTNPLHRLRLVDKSECFHFVGGPTLEVIARIERTLYNTNLLLAHVSREKRIVYLKEILFYGMYPFCHLDKRKGYFFGFVKMTLKYVYFVWFFLVSIKLVVRGLLGLPIAHIKWSGYKKYSYAKKL